MHKPLAALVLISFPLVRGGVIDDEVLRHHLDKRFDGMSAH